MDCIHLWRSSASLGNAWNDTGCSSCPPTGPFDDDRAAGPTGVEAGVVEVAGELFSEVPLDVDPGAKPLLLLAALSPSGALPVDAAVPFADPGVKHDADSMAFSAAVFAYPERQFGTQHFLPMV